MSVINILGDQTCVTASLCANKGILGSDMEQYDTNVCHEKNAHYCLSLKPKKKLVRVHI